MTSGESFILAFSNLRTFSADWLIQFCTSTVLIIFASTDFRAQNSQAVPLATDNPHSLRGSGMSFTPNKGQIADMKGKLRPDILFKGATEGADVYIRKTGISYVQSNMAEVMHGIEEEVEEKEKAEKISEDKKQKLKEELLSKALLKVHRLDMDFERANLYSEATGNEQAEGYTNYYYAHCPQGITNVYSYNSVTQSNIYKGIDIKYFGGKEGGLKYDIIVHPGADPHQIKFRWKGADHISINHEGTLVIKTGVNEFTETLPKVYQNINGKIIDVKANYNLTLSPKGRVGEGLVTFELGTWSPEHPLIIDPWVTYYGGTGFDMGADITTDETGNVYVTGQTGSTSQITSLGFQNVFGGSYDAFLVKFNSGGSRIWATYYGGAGADAGYSVAVDRVGNAYLTGSAGAGSIVGIASGGFQNVFGGNYDAFLVKFNSGGSRIWATYYGGIGFDYGYGVTADGAGNVYLAGLTRGSTNIASGGFQNLYGDGDGDAFLVKFDPGGARIWATYYGGSGYDDGRSVAIDVTGNVYLAGLTASVTGIASGGFQNVLRGLSDAFLVKFDPGGNRVWATYYGGTGDDSGHSTDVDGAGNIIYLSGRTNSVTGIASGGFQNVLGGGEDAFLVKFTSSGLRVWATYLGGASVDYGLSLVVDPDNNDVFVSGDTYSLNFPITSCAWQKNLAGGISEDSFVAHFKPDGKIVCSSYVGGPGTSDDEYCSIALHGCYVYMTGYTGGSYPVTPGAHQTVYRGGLDAFVAQLYKSSCGFDKTTALSATVPTGSLCNNTPLNFTGNFSVSCESNTASYLWSFPGATPSNSTAQNPTGIVYPSPGTYTVTLKAKTACDSAEKLINVVISLCSTCNLNAQFVKGTSNCPDCKTNGCKEWIMVTGKDGTEPYSYQWPDGYDKRYRNGLCPGAYNVKVTDKSGCSVNVNLTAP
ncbi:MAG: SBBP repeat-containing protein [Bacteroidetes bacterium]|nr:SBBP repeat-containing protein [Bacteroidota bacterium]